MPDSVATESAQTPSSSTPSLERFRALQLDEKRLDEQLAVLSETRQTSTDVSSGLTISLPLPDCSFAHVELVPDHVLAPELEKQHPELKVWSVMGGDKRVVGGVVDRTPLGLHAMLELRSGDTVFIDPDESVKGQRRYVSFSKRNNPKAFAAAMKGFKCGNHDHDHAKDDLVQKLLDTEPQPTAERGSTRVLGQNLNTYKLALATTAEFTQANGGATTTNQRLFTLIARVNQIFQRDLSIKFNLVGGTSIIQTNLGDAAQVGDGLGDGYSNFDKTGNLLLPQNQTMLDSVLGVNGYDVGHVLTTGGVGWGQLFTPCSSQKARGTSAISTPLGSTAAIEGAAIDMLAHELGHQFGARHTFNASTGLDCAAVNGQPTRDAGGAVEPGAGTTIMSYAGQCSGNNILPAPTTGSTSEAMFHAHTLQLMTAFAHNGGGNTCGTRPAIINPNTGLTNRNPTMSMPAQVYIPARTPFTLPVVTTTDADNDPISYAWDQINIGGTAANKNQDRINSALIRSRLPQYGNSSRTIPNLPALLAGTAVDGEHLPITTRVLNFRLVARDQRGGVAQGNYVVNVRNTGAAFSVPNTMLPASGAIKISWNVAGTNASPINCSQVNISLINATGVAYANLGTHNNTGITANTVRLPATIQTGSRVKVACSNNIFFAISGRNPTVAAP
ncbi:M12 family metallo-peptidase [Thiothrix eikelboomii]|uniref:M12 family metallo-peptidase n=1 Tax=Thiothrix eikelboomii TaxID=92487 RepID=UPI0011806D91|nr:M12 family metallo-peptidase [Thiothrix eikelboomii]